MTIACLYMFVFDECPLPPKHSQLQPKLRLRVRRLFLTESNTGLASKGQGHAEFGSCWKASHVKMLLWWFSKKATEFANMTRDTLLVQLIFEASTNIRVNDACECFKPLISNMSLFSQVEF